MGRKEKVRQWRQPKKSRRKGCVRKMLRDWKKKLVDILTIDDQYRSNYCSKNNCSNLTRICY